MSEPKLHHYVPQFYLKYFADSRGQLFVWDKGTGRVFPSATRGIAAQTHFYKVPELVGTTEDPLFLEKGLSQLEGDIAELYGSLVPVLESAAPRDEVALTEGQRWALATFVAVQFLRSAEQREILGLFAEESGIYKGPVTANERANLHARLIVDGGLADDLIKRLVDSVWIFARNDTHVPFWTSDAPVAFKSRDSKMWLKGPGMFSHGSYAVFPLTPKYILYCKERQAWEKVAHWDCCLSPVQLTPDMVQHENSGQVFMATRHVISPVKDFSWADTFSKTIG